MSCKHKHTSRALDKELDSMMRGGSESSGLKVPPARNKSSSSSSSSSSPYRTPDQRVVPSTTTRPSSGHKSHYARILTPTKTSSVIGGHSKRLSITTKSSAPSTPISNTGSNGIARSGGRKVEPILSPSQRIAKNVITRTPAPTERYEEYQTFTSLTVPPAPSSIVSNPLVDITLYNSSPHSNFVAEATHVPLQAQEPQPTGRVLFVSPREKENMINTSLQADPGPEQASSLARLATRLDTTAPRLLKALRDVDRDKDGLLSYNDFKRGVTSANLNVTSADLDLVVKDLDSQRAGVVDYVEFVRSVNDAKQTQLQSSGPGPGPAEKAGSRFLVSPTPDCFLNGYERGVRQVLRGKQDYALFPKDAHGKNVALSASDRLLRSPFGVSCKADADMYYSPMAADALCATNRAQSDVSARKGAAAAATTASVPAQESIDSFSNVFPAAARGQAEGPFSFARSTSARMADVIQRRGSTSAAFAPSEKPTSNEINSLYHAHAFSAGHASLASPTATEKAEILRRLIKQVQLITKEKLAMQQQLREGEYWNPHNVNPRVRRESLWKPDAYVGATPSPRSLESTPQRPANRLQGPGSTGPGRGGKDGLPAAGKPSSSRLSTPRTVPRPSLSGQNTPSHIAHFQYPHEYGSDAGPTVEFLVDNYQVPVGQETRSTRSPPASRRSAYQSSHAYGSHYAIGSRKGKGETPVSARLVRSASVPRMRPALALKGRSGLDSLPAAQYPPFLSASTGPVGSPLHDNNCTFNNDALQEASLQLGLMEGRPADPSADGGAVVGSLPTHMIRPRYVHDSDHSMLHHRDADGAAVSHPPMAPHLDWESHVALSQSKSHKALWDNVRRGGTPLGLPAAAAVDVSALPAAGVSTAAALHERVAKVRSLLAAASEAQTVAAGAAAIAAVGPVDQHGNVISAMPESVAKRMHAVETRNAAKAATTPPGLGWHFAASVPVTPAALVRNLTSNFSIGQSPRSAVGADGQPLGPVFAPDSFSHLSVDIGDALVPSAPHLDGRNNIRSSSQTSTGVSASWSEGRQRLGRDGKVYFALARPSSTAPQTQDVDQRRKLIVSANSQAGGEPATSLVVRSDNFPNRSAYIPNVSPPATELMNIADVAAHVPVPARVDPGKAHLYSKKISIDRIPSVNGPFPGKLSSHLNAICHILPPAGAKSGVSATHASVYQYPPSLTRSTSLNAASPFTEQQLGQEGAPHASVDGQARGQTRPHDDEGIHSGRVSSKTQWDVVAASAPSSGRSTPLKTREERGPSGRVETFPYHPVSRWSGPRCSHMNSSSIWDVLQYQT